MSIKDLREQGLEGITMRYEEGGVQVFTMNGKEVRLGPGIIPTAEKIKAALKETE